jgi:hypothetical protein
MLMHLLLWLSMMMKMTGELTSRQRFLTSDDDAVVPEKSGAREGVFEGQIQQEETSQRQKRPYPLPRKENHFSSHRLDCC